MPSLPLVVLLCTTICLALSSSGAPHVAIPLTTQLNASNPLAVLSGAFPLPQHESETETPTLRTPHAWSFSIGWLAETFSNPDASSSDLMYWATQGTNGSELPDWLQFDDHTLTFFGISPTGSLTESYQEDNIVIYMHSASNTIHGSATASVSFILQVSDNSLVITKPPLSIVTTANQDIDTDLRSWLNSSLVFTRGSKSLDTLNMTIDTRREEWLYWDRSVPIRHKSAQHAVDTPYP